RPGAQAALLEVLRKQGCEISRSTAAFTVTLPAKKPARPTATPEKAASGPTTNPSDTAQSTDRPKDEPKEAAPTATPTPEGKSDSGQPPAKDKPAQPTVVNLPAGSYIIRMDQPYSRVADALLDHQYWSPNDPQKTPYDDTGWTFGELFNVKVLRVVDPKVLATPMETVKGIKLHGGVSGGSSVFVINANADTALATLRYRLKDASIEAAEEPFEAGGRKFARGSLIVSKVDSEALRREVEGLGLQAVGVAAAPSVKSHPLRVARVALLHTWLSTQTEG